MLGNSLFDYTHPDDIPEVTKELFTKRETEHGNANIEREDETGMKNLNKVELEQSFDQGKLLFWLFRVWRKIVLS